MVSAVGDDHAKRVPPQVRSSVNTTADAISRMPPSQSTLRLRWNTGMRAIRGSSRPRPSNANGTLIQKIIDQCRCSANTPPRIGPPIPAATQTPLK